MEKSEKSAAPAPSSSASGGKEQIEKQARQLAYDVRYKTKQSMSANKGAKMDPAAVRKAYVAQLGKSTGSPPVKARAREMLLGENYINIKEFASESVASIIKKVFAEKLDPVGKEDSDVDNDGKKNTKSDKYIKNKREKIGKAIDSEGDKKFKVRVTDKGTGNTYVRMATRAKIAELRANTNISSVEITGHGEPNSTKAEDYLRGELIEKKSKDEEEKKITGKGVNNKKLIKVFPNQVSEEAEPEKDDKTEKQIASKEKKLSIIKKQVLLKKMQAVRQGAGSEIVAHTELEGETIEESEKVAQGAQKRATELGAKRRQASYKKYGANVGSPGKNERAGYNLARKARSADSSPETQVTKKKKPAGSDTSQIGHERKRDEKTDTGKSGKKLKTPKYKLSFKDRQTHHTRSAFDRKDPKKNPKHTANTQEEGYQSILDAYLKIYEHHQKDKDGNTIPHEGVTEGNQRDPENLKKDKTHSKQPDPSKDNFTGIGNMSIKDIMKMNKKMKKEEVTVEAATPQSGTGKYYKEGKPTTQQLAQREKRQKIKDLTNQGKHKEASALHNEEKKKEEQEDPRSMGTKYRNIKNKLRSLGIKFVGPTLGEEGYDRMRDDRLVKYGIGHDGSDRKGSTSRPTGKQPKGKTVYQKQAEKEHGKGVTALDIVKKKIEKEHGKGAIMKNKKK